MEVIRDAKDQNYLVRLFFLQKDIEHYEQSISALNHSETDVCTTIEREFLRTLEGGCTAPIGALAKIKDQRVFFKGCLHALDGSAFVEVTKERTLDKIDGFGKSCAYDLLEKGGKQLMDEIKNELNNSVH